MRRHTKIILAITFVLIGLSTVIWANANEHKSESSTSNPKNVTQVFQFASGTVEFETESSVGVLQSRRSEGSGDTIYATTQLLIDASYGGCSLTGPDVVAPLGAYTLSRINSEDREEDSPLWIAERVRVLGGGWYIYFTSSQSTCGAPELEVELTSNVKEALAQSGRLK